MLVARCPQMLARDRGERRTIYDAANDTQLVGEVVRR